MFDTYELTVEYPPGTSLTLFYVSVGDGVYLEEPIEFPVNTTPSMVHYLCTMQVEVNTKEVKRIVLTNKDTGKHISLNKGDKIEEIYAGGSSNPSS